MSINFPNKIVLDFIPISILFAILIMTPFSFAEAIVLEQVVDVSLQQVSITTIKEGEFSVSFTAVNNSTTLVSDARYGIRTQDLSGETVYTQTYEIPVNLAPAVLEDVILEFAPPTGIVGSYDIFLVVKNSSGTTLAVAFVEELTINQGSRSTPTSNLVGCEVASIEKLVFICEISGDGGILGYRVFEGSIFGEQLMEGSTEVTKGDVKIDLTDRNLASGKYAMVFELRDKNGEVVPIQQSKTFIVPGTWMTIENISQKPFINNKFEAVVYFNGVGENTKRGFKYWILASDGAVCASGELDVQQQIPRNRVIEKDIQTDCTNPTLSGFLYSGVNTDGTYNVIDMLGEIPTDELVAKESIISVTRFLDSFKDDSYLAFIIFSILVSLALLYFVWTRGRGKGGTVLLSVIFLFSMFGNATFTEAAVFLSADEDNVSFTVNLDQAQYNVTENITFSFNFVDTNTGQKPSSGVVKVQVDGGSFTEIVSASDTATSYNVSLAPISSAGTYALNFEAPGLCGSTFGFSLFGIAKFGSDKCEFSVNVVVYANTAPTPPKLRGSCVVGANNQYEFSSTDASDLFYEVDFDSDGSIDTRIPSSGTMSPAPIWGSTYYNGWLTQGNKSLRAQATDSNGLASGWQNYAISCTASCSAPVVCNGATASTTMYAQPVLVKPGDTSTIYWNLENVLTCSIAGTNGDSWDWSIVGSQTQQNTSVINTDTTYTLSCTDFDGGSVSDTAKVRLVPNWQEF